MSVRAAVQLSDRDALFQFKASCTNGTASCLLNRDSRVSALTLPLCVWLLLRRRNWRWADPHLQVCCALHGRHVRQGTGTFLWPRSKAGDSKPKGERFLKTLLCHCNLRNERSPYLSVTPELIQYLWRKVRALLLKHRCAYNNLLLGCLLSKR